MEVNDLAVLMELAKALKTALVIDIEIPRNKISIITLNDVFGPAVKLESYKLRVWITSPLVTVEYLEAFNMGMGGVEVLKLQLADPDIISKIVQGWFAYRRNYWFLDES